MSLLTLEVELDHGHVVVRGSEPLPDKASALLTILPATEAARDPLVSAPESQRVDFHEASTRPVVSVQHQPAPAPAVVRNGIRLFPLREGAGVVTPELVRELLEESA